MADATQLRAIALAMTDNTLNMHQTKKNNSFWQEMNQLAASNPIVIDRPKSSTHPRHPQLVYPFDYGYLENTTAADGSGIDLWMGSPNKKVLTGILCTFDTLKRDAEIKLLIDCAKEEIEMIYNFHSEMCTRFMSSPTADS